MTRIARIVMPDVAHHITQRGIRRLDVFRDDSDRKAYLRLFIQSCRRFDLRVLAYCLMTNHIHFVAVPGNKHSISKTFHRCHTVYATKFNEKYAVTGHLWQGRPYSSVLDETHLWAAVRYVELNPVRAGIVSQAQDYPWSSARAHCKLIQDRLIESGWPSPGLINDWSAWLHDVDSPAADKRIRETTFKGQPCGDDEFVAWLSSALGRSLGKKKPGPKVKRIDSRE